MSQCSDPRITRLRYEPVLDKYILAYSDELRPRVAEPSELGDLRQDAITPQKAPPGALAAPLSVQIAATSACNLACCFCYAELNNQNSDCMTTAEMRRVIDLLHKQGVIELQWAGGEPLLNHDLVSLLRYAHKLDFKQSLLTNGTCFNQEFLQVAPTLLQTVQVSLDDLESCYNNIKGGDYWQVLEENVRLAAEAGLPLVASVVLSRRNAPRLEQIVEHIWKSGMSVARISWQVPMGMAKDVSLDDYESFMREMEKPIRLLQKRYIDRGLNILAIGGKPESELSEFLPKEFLLCSAARTRLHIDWNGDAYPCPVLKYPEFCAGNILENDFEKIWFSHAFDGIRSVRNGPECEKCRMFCSYWCRALVYGFTRDITRVPSPLCRYHG